MLKLSLKFLLNPTINDHPLPDSTAEFPQGATAEDTTFELHIRDREIIISMVNFLEGVRDPYTRGHICFLLRSTLLLIVEVTSAAAYLQENEHDGPLNFVWLLDMDANKRRIYESYRRKAYLYTKFKCLVDGLLLDYKSEPSALHRYPYSWFRHC